MNRETTSEPEIRPHAADAAAGSANKKLHILIVDPFFQTPDRPGATRTHDLARHWLRHGHRVSILGTAQNDAASSEGLTVSSARAHTPSFGQAAPASFAGRFAAGAAFKIWRFGDVDAVVAADRPLRLLPALVFFTRWRGVPLILDVAAGPPTPELPEAPFLKKCTTFAQRAVFRFAAACAKRLTTVTPALKDRLIENGVAEGKVGVSVLGCDTSPLPDALPRLFGDFPDLEKRPYVVFAGAMPEHRPLEDMIDIVAALPNRSAAFVFCGDGPAQKRLKDHARGRGLADTDILFPGALPRHEVRLLLRRAVAAFTDCSPDARGGFLFDALAAGKPIILCGHGWQRDVVEGRGAGYSLPVRDPASAGKELADFLGDADGLRRAEQQAAALAAGRLNLERVAKDFRALIQDAVAADPREAVLRRRTLAAKRLLDIVISTVGLIVLSPVIVGLAIAIRVKMGGPVFFRQRRTGLHGHLFTLYKFRTMAEENKGARDDESRLTPLGRALRRTSLDEIPELVNVLKGDMSLVGPRPLLPEYLPYYTAEQRRRHDLRPGLTGWAQINGRNALSWEDRFTFDVWYVDHVSFGLDLKILAKTLWVAVRGDGISADGHATMPRFDEVMARRQGAEDV